MPMPTLHAPGYNGLSLFVYCSRSLHVLSPRWRLLCGGKEASRRLLEVVSMSIKIIPGEEEAKDLEAPYFPGHSDLTEKFTYQFCMDNKTINTRS